MLGFLFTTTVQYKLHTNPENSFTLSRNLLLIHWRHSAMAWELNVPTLFSLNWKTTWSHIHTYGLKYLRHDGLIYCELNPQITSRHCPLWLHCDPQILRTIQVYANLLLLKTATNPTQLFALGLNSPRIKIIPPFWLKNYLLSSTSFPFNMLELWQANGTCRR